MDFEIRCLGGKPYRSTSRTAPSTGRIILFIFLLFSETGTASEKSNIKACPSIFAPSQTTRGIEAMMQRLCRISEIGLGH
jgi:hypothetical protein